MIASNKRMKNLEQARKQRLKKASKKTGFQEGMFYDYTVKPAQAYLINVSFYPKEVWWAQKMELVDDNHGHIGWTGKSKDRLTQELWDKLEGLRL